MSLTVLFDKARYLNGDGTSTGSETVACTIDGSSIITGHRYFVFATGNSTNSYANTIWRFKNGGVTDGDLDGRYTSGGGQALTHKMFTMITGTNGQDLTLTVTKSGSNNGFWWNAYLMAIDLDSGGLVENVDWFYSENTTSETPHHSYGSEVNPADLTWTPDGSSDYLVMGSVTMDNTNGLRRESMRLFDITNSINLFQSGIGGSNGSTEHHVGAGFAVVSAPAATSRTYRTQWRQFGAASPGKQNANVGILRLDAFQAHEYFDIDVNADPPNTNLTSAGTINITPVTNGELVVMSAAMCETDGQNQSSSQGIIAYVDQDSTQFWGTNQALGSSTSFPHAGHTNYTGDTGGRLGSYMFEHITGLTNDVSTEFELRYRADTTSQNKIRQTMLLAFSTQEVINPPTVKASNPSPSNGATDVSPVIDLSWDAGEGGGTITHDVYFGLSQTAVTNANNGSPEFKGNTDLLVFDPKPLGGQLTGNTTYYWRIDTVNEGGTLKGDTWSFSIFPGPSNVTGHSPADTAIDVDPFDVTISWAASTGSGSISYDAYFGTSEIDVTNGTGGTQLPNQTGTSIDVGDLNLSTTYYWRVNSLNGAATTTGDVVSFTTLSAPPQASGPDPADTETGVLPDKILTWDASTGGGTITRTVYFGTNETDVANGTGGTLKGTVPSPVYEPGLLEEFQTYYWRVDIGNEAGTTTGDVWEFTTAEAVDIPSPSEAIDPSPADDSTEQLLDITLSWEPGTGVGSVFNDIYLGADINNLEKVSSFQAASSYSIPEQLQGGTTYYWRVDSLDTFGGITTGETWAFTTKSFAPKVINAINRPFPVTVEVHFDVELLEEEDGALDPDNYTFNHGAYATSVKIIDDKQVRLTVENLFEFDSFIVTVSDKVRGFSEEGVNPSFNSYTFALANRPTVDDSVQSFSSANGRLKSGSVVTKLKEDSERWYIQTESGMDVINKASLRNEGFILDGYGFNTIFVG